MTAVALEPTLSGDVIATLCMAREMRPGKKNNLDALCAEFAVNNSGRQLHGALLNAELLGKIGEESKGKCQLVALEPMQAVAE